MMEFWMAEEEVELKVESRRPDNVARAAYINLDAHEGASSRK